ncbi:MAG TPA: phosphatase PAP2 family protein [Bryobacteraceae bacterium]|nr:phosphatase PAP2 family protein [Bryobacteraceae bacterium]
MTRSVYLILTCLISSAAALPQQRSPDADEVNKPENAVSPKDLVLNIVRDQKPIWTFPWHAVHGEHWKPLLGVTLATTALVVLDPYTEPYFRNNPGFSTYKTGPLRGRNSTLAITLTPVAFYLTGLATHSRHAQNTALLAAEGIADTQLVSLVMKHVAGRLIPDQIPAHGNFRDSWFKYQGTFSNGGSFPSGHAASAFAVATVISTRYRQHRWVPWASYGTAAFLALTRLPDQAHFTSDIFFGAAMGYAITRFVVLRR